MSTATVPAFALDRLLALPRPRELGRLFLGGFAGLMAWEAFARVLTPLVVGGPLQPAALVISLFERQLDFNPGWAAAETIHYLTGIVLYPLLYLAYSRLLGRGVLLDGLAWGVITWILALGVFASLAGLPFVLGFIPLSWMSLVGHVIYAGVAVWIFKRAA